MRFVSIWKGLSFVVYLLSVCISCTVSSNEQSCVLNGLQYLMLVFDMIGHHMVFAYCKMGRVIALNIETISSICLLHLVEVNAFRILSVVLLW